MIVFSPVDKVRFSSCIILGSITFESIKMSGFKKIGFHFLTKISQEFRSGLDSEILYS